MAKFVVDLGNVKMTDEEQNGIASAVHAAVIGRLASLSNPGLHDATKTLNRAGMIVAGSDRIAKAGRTANTGEAKAARGKAVAAKPAASSRAARKSG